MSKLWPGFLVAGLISTLTVGTSHGIEMFTFFGDGSRIGLPSLEVPIEAYPGIPLRSDRIRARRRGMRAMPAPQAQPGMPPGVTIRVMPTEQAAPLPPTIRAKPASGRGGLPVPPLPPEPDEILKPSEGSRAGSANRPLTSARPVTDSAAESIKVQPPLADPR